MAKDRTLPLTIARSLRRLSWLFYRHFTPAGWFVLGALALFGAIGMDTNQSVAYQVFTLLAALLAVSFLSGLAVRPRLEAHRTLPETVTAGGQISYRLAIRNLDAKAYSSVVLAEDNREGREILRVKEASVPDLPPHSSMEVHEELTALRRGKLNLTGLTVLAPHPMGLTRSAQHLALHSSILVLPKRYPVPPVNLSGTRKYQPGGVALSSSIGESLEFESLRDYRPGDPLRRIHWRSWARTGKLIVKEYQDEYFVRHALVLDTFPTSDNAEVFEEAVSVAASFASSVLTQESLLDLLFVGAETYRFTAGRGLAGPERMLEVLACVTPCTNKTFKDLHHSVIGGCSALSGCICVLLGWDEPRQDFVRNLEALQVPVLALLIVDRPTPQPSQRNVRVLELGKIAEGLARI
jgi:uncharacterized protein (DUF58 family)